MIYNQFFGLKEAPFQLTPDTHYFFEYPSHLEALNTLILAIKSGEGFVKVTGEVGTGKTLLSRKLMRMCAASFTLAYIPNPRLSPAGLQRALATELEIPAKLHHNAHQLLNAIYLKLIERQRKGKPILLVIDEAQTLPEDTLESLRLLTNMETEKSKLLQVVLFGQPELDTTLNQDNLRQLKQRIVFNYYLKPMAPKAIEHYIDHRLERAGYQGQPLVSVRAKRKIAKHSQGIPRLINILAHKALMAAYGQHSTTVESRHVSAAIRDTESVMPEKNTRVPLTVLGVSASICIALTAGFFVLGV